MSNELSHSINCLQGKKKLPLNTSWLTDRESEVLQGYALGLTNDELAKSYDLSPKTITTFYARGMYKLALEKRSDLIQWAWRSGFVK